MIKLIREMLNRCGFDLIRFPHLYDKRFVDLLCRLGIDVLFDVGANKGQFGLALRSYGYKNKIVSFEPLTEAYNVLLQRVKDSNWCICNSAIGNEDGQIEINVSENLVSSSILEMQKTHLDACPSSSFCKKEIVPICKIDSVFDKYVDKSSKVFIKIDTQGFEKNVIEGSLQSLPRIEGFIMELSFVTLYKGETLFFDMVSYMASLGYELWQIIPGFYDKNSQRILQSDVVFVRK